MPDKYIPQQKRAASSLDEIIQKITDAHNILIALSLDPSVDELAAAIGLSVYLQKFDKRVVAIYSGATPNALEFLRPSDTFDNSADVLQDFVIAISKDKADHLRYRPDGDFVKIFITPFKTRISEADIECSYGDYNVDLVIALDVANGIDLDEALREHGRIMHDASIINITTGNPGRFGEIEWSNQNASSVSEMLANLAYIMSGEVAVEKEEATAFLTGIVAATNRFSNSRTSADSMQVASRLMESGADQQLIAKNITTEVDNELSVEFQPTTNDVTVEQKEEPVSSSNEISLDIEHDDEAVDQQNEVAPAQPAEANQNPVQEVAETQALESNEADLVLEDELRAAEAVLASTGDEVVEEKKNEPVVIANDTPLPDNQTLVNAAAALEEPTVVAESTIPEASTMANSVITPDTQEIVAKETTITPSEDFLLNNEPLEGETNRYGQMLQEALENDQNLAAAIAPQVNNTEIFSAPEIDYGINDNVAPAEMVATAPVLPVEPVEAASAPINSEPMPAAMSEPAIVPEPMMPEPAVMPGPTMPPVPNAEYVAPAENLPMPGAEILPPPPTPAIDFSNMTGLPDVEAVVVPQPMPAIEPAQPLPTISNTQNLGPQPAMQDQVYNPVASDPAAFKIPGM